MPETLQRSDVDEVLEGWRILVEDKIREVGAPNDGPDVRWILASTGNAPGDPWCAAAVYHVGRSRLGKRWPLPRTASCDVLLEAARKRGLLRERPARGYLGLVMKSETDAVHVFIVSEAFADGSFRTGEGNTNDAGGRDGIGAFARTRGTIADTARYLFIDWSSACASRSA